MKRAVGFMVVSALLAGSIFASDISTQDEMHQVVVQEQPAEENKSGLFSRIHGGRCFQTEINKIKMKNEKNPYQDNQPPLVVCPRKYVIC